MAIKSKEELIQSVSARVGEDTSDEAIALIEDVTDTLNDLETRANGDGTDWEAEYNKLDKEWRDKYKARFLDGGNDNNDNDNNNNDNNNDNDDKPKTYKYEDLFETKE